MTMLELALLHQARGGVIGPVPEPVRTEAESAELRAAQLKKVFDAEYSEEELGY